MNAKDDAERLLLFGHRFKRQADACVQAERWLSRAARDLEEALDHPVGIQFPWAVVQQLRKVLNQVAVQVDRMEEAATE